jgi:fermentation-respiration switch protein FrsA (DUF1100 family)
MRRSPFVVVSQGHRLPGELYVPDAPRALVLFLHGIPSGRPADPNDDDPGYPGLTKRFASRGFATAWFDMRGVRESEGDFSPFAWELDVHEVLDALAARPEIAALPRILVGASGSGPTALRVTAARDDIIAVATLAAVATWRGEGFLPDPETLVLHFRSIGIIRDPNAPADLDAWWREFDEDARGVLGSIAPRPILFIHGEADDVVPYHHAELLHDAASEPKELVRIPGAGHQLRRDERALDALGIWLGRLIPN